GCLDLVQDGPGPGVRIGQNERGVGRENALGADLAEVADTRFGHERLRVDAGVIAGHEEAVGPERVDGLGDGPAEGDHTRRRLPLTRRSRRLGAGGQRQRRDGEEGEPVGREGRHGAYSVVVSKLREPSGWKTYSNV